MKLRQKWFEYEIGLQNGDTVRDKVPANSETEAREKVRRIYRHTRFISLRHQYVENNLDKFMRQREQAASSNPFPEDDSAVTIKCPACGKRVELSPPVVDRLHKCPACESRFLVRRDSRGKLVFELAAQVAPAHALTTDPWQVLGIAETEDKGEVKRAYIALIKQYHPDKVAALGPELIALAEKKTLEINKAYQAIVSRIS